MTIDASKKQNRAFSWLNRNILSLGFVSLFTDLSTEMSYAVIPIFLKDVLRAQPIFIGLVEAVAECTASVLKTFSGYISDRLRKRKLFLFIGYTLSAVVKPLLALATSGWHVLAVRFADRFGKGIRAAPRDALIADSSQVSYLGRSFGFHRAMDTLGAVLGPLVAFLILYFFAQNYRLLFGLALVPGLAAIGIIIFGVKDIMLQAQSVFRFTLRDFSPQLKVFLLIIVTFTLGNSSDAFLLLRARETGISATMIPLLWLAFNLAYFLWSYPAGIISDRFGRKRTIILGFLIFSACYTALALNRSIAGVWVIFLIYGLYYGFTEGNLRAYIADLTPAGIRGTVFGVYHTVIGLALLPANLIMGSLWQKFGFNIALLVGASFSFVAALMIVILLRSKREENKIINGK